MRENGKRCSTEYEFAQARMSISSHHQKVRTYFAGASLDGIANGPSIQISPLDPRGNAPSFKHTYHRIVMDARQYRLFAANRQQDYLLYTGE